MATQKKGGGSRKRSAASRSKAGAKKRATTKKGGDAKEPPAPAHAASVAELSPNPGNPRRATPENLARLARSMRENGDLGGILRNRRTGNLVGGNQRTSRLPEDASITVVKVFDPPSRAGTVALGYVTFEGELFAYREVDWPEEREKAAMVRANVPAGEWDKEALGRVLASLRESDQGDMFMTGLDGDQVARLIAKAFPPAPQEFPGVDPDNLPTDYRCPMCAYEWSGQAKPETGMVEDEAAAAGAEA